MRNRVISSFGFLAVLAVGLGSSGGLRAAADEPIGRLHWLGKAKLAGESNAAALVATWKLPESQALEAEALDKFALALASGLQSQASSLQPQAATNFLRPLLADLVRAESYVEMRQSGGQAAEAVLAVRLDAQHAARWETDVAAILQGCGATAGAPAQNGARCWQWPKNDGTGASRAVCLDRAGDWTLLSLGPNPSPEPSAFSQLVARIRREKAPFPARATNYWLEADADLARLLPALGCAWRPETGLPKATLSAIGDGAWVHSSALLTFPEPLPLRLDPWLVPTNLITNVVSGFTAARGFAPWLASLGAWQRLQVGPPPSQFFWWDCPSSPVASSFAALQPEASNQIARLTDRVLEASRSWPIIGPKLAFAKSPRTGTLVWTGLPFIDLSLKPVATQAATYLFGNFFHMAGTNSGLPPELLQELLSRTNLAAYGWEVTAQRCLDWYVVGQALRYVAERHQFPPTAATTWIRYVGGKFGPAATEVVQTRPEQLSIKRTSAVGFTGLELHLLVEWLESPQFPRGFYSLLVKAPEPEPPRPLAPATPPASARKP